MTECSIPAANEVARGRPRLAGILAGAILGVALLSGCDGILDVDESGVILPSDLERAGPAAVPSIVNGMVGSYHEAVDDIVRYTSLFTDEMILSGTFTARAQVDARRIPVNNQTLTGGMYTPLHQARHQADTTAFQFARLLDDPAFEGAQGALREGVVLGRLYGGFSRLWLAELYCWSILTGVHPESQPVMPDDRMADALFFLQQAETLATAEGMEEVRLAAIVGQARAHLWRRNYQQAAALAETVPRGFVYWAEFSHNSPGQFNEVYAFTWGDTQAIRWTVGDGTTTSRGNERWEHFDEFVRLNLLESRPDGFSSFNGAIPVGLQKLYSRAESGIMIASGIEARLIRAEAAVRAGQTGPAQTLVNDLRSDFSLRATIRFQVTPPDPENELEDIELTGDLTADVQAVAAERARELWLTGDRHTTSRRLRLDPQVSIDLFPAVKIGINGGDDIAFPMVQLELDHNPNLGSSDACPAGQEPGSWR